FSHASVPLLVLHSFPTRRSSDLCLVGASGCGKSTLLNIIAGLEQPDSGQVLADGQPVTGPGRERMMMFQESALFPWLDVMGNLIDRKSTRLNSSHLGSSYAVFCL